MLSMTGFGRGEWDDGDLQVTVEIKTVNNRYSEFIIKQPRNYLALEDAVKKFVGRFIVRGRVEIFVQARRLVSAHKVVRVNQERARSYHEGLRELCGALGEPYDFDVYRLVALPDVLVEEETEEDLQAVWLVLEKALAGALEQLMAMRSQEGQAIGADLAKKLADLRTLHGEIAARSPVVVPLYRERLQGRIDELLGDGRVDGERLAQEVAIFADKCCIDEELVRLGSHFEQFEQIIAAEGSIGRKLDFLVQEMNRETNTIGSKANDLQIAQLVVEMKSQLEKIREQVQNIE